VQRNGCKRQISAKLVGADRSLVPRRTNRNGIVASCRTNGRTDRRTYRTIVVGRASSPRRQGPSRQTSARRPSLIDPATAATSPARSLGRHRVNVPRRGAIETDAGGRAGLLNCTRRDRTFVPPSPGHLGPDLQNILRQSYDYLTIMRKLRSICDGRLIFQTVLRMEKGFS